MSYRCGLGPGIPGGPTEPRIICDGCRVVLPVVTRRGTAPVWFLDGRAAPRWEMVRADGVRRDYCPSCKITRRIDVPRAGTSKEGE